jgi:hypothetical protein
MTFHGAIARSTSMEMYAVLYAFLLWHLERRHRSVKRFQQDCVSS